MIEFAWNKNKASANVKKHGISFEEAKTVFSDEQALIIHDSDHSEQEDRFILLGMSYRTRILLVCHCYKEIKGIIRIISARVASKKEQDQYWEALK